VRAREQGAIIPAAVAESRSVLPFPPVEPPAVPEVFPDPRAVAEGEVVAVSRTLSPGLVLSAYRRGIFPWPVSDRLVPWVSPDPRAVFPLEQAPHWPRSLRKTLKRGTFTVSVNRAFTDVIVACGEGREGGTWITRDVLATYGTLHRLGWAHSVEVWDEDGALAGGLYGLAIGAAFAGESMFHRKTDASKVAFVTLVERLRERGFELLDAQVLTDHLASLGCVTVRRDEFLDRLARARSHTARFGDE
jgi:leucyl/phenylalanyl-tRNA--protein transferase